MLRRSLLMAGPAAVLAQAVLAKEAFGMSDNGRVRARDIGLVPGVLRPGALNALTDVAGVRVGHATLIEGASVRTGVTAILPHAGNLFQDKVPAGLAVAKAHLQDSAETLAQALAAKLERVGA